MNPLLTLLHGIGLENAASLVAGSSAHGVSAQANIAAQNAVAAGGQGQQAGLEGSFSNILSNAALIDGVADALPMDLGEFLKLNGIENIEGLGVDGNEGADVSSNPLAAQAIANLITSALQEYNAANAAAENNAQGQQVTNQQKAVTALEAVIAKLQQHGSASNNVVPVDGEGELSQNGLPANSKATAVINNNALEKAVTFNGLPESAAATTLSSNATELKQNDKPGKLVPVVDKTGTANQSVTDILSRIPTAVQTASSSLGKELAPAQPQQVAQSTPDAVQQAVSQNVSNLAVAAGKQADNKNSSGQQKDGKLLAATKTASTVFNNSAADAAKIDPQNRFQVGRVNVTQFASPQVNLISTGGDNAILGSALNDTLNNNVGNSSNNNTINNIASLESSKPADITHSAKELSNPRYVAQTPSEQVSVKIASAVKSGNSKIVIQLEPASLGRVTVQIDMPVDNRVNISVLADKLDTLDLLKQDARSLERALQDAGIKADSSNLSFNLRGGNSNPSSRDGSGQYSNLSNQQEQLFKDEMLELLGIEGEMAYVSNRALDIRV